MTAVRMTDVMRRFPGRGTAFVLGPITLEIATGSWCVLTGRSRAGKTTLLQLAAGLDRPDDGRIEVMNAIVSGADESALATLRRERLGVIHQQFTFLDHLPAWENVSCRFVPVGASRRERRARAETALKRVGLERLAERLPRELSGGEQQRLAVARAIVADPALVIADEPTSQVDAETAAHVVSSLRDLHAAGATILIATHDPALVDGADRVIEMQDGRTRLS